MKITGWPKSNISQNGDVPWVIAGVVKVAIFTFLNLFARVPLGHFVLHHPRSIQMLIASKLQLKDRVKVVVAGFAEFDGKGQEHCCLKVAQIPLSSPWVHLKSGGGRESSASFRVSDIVLMFSKAPARITQCCRRVGPNESPGPRQWPVAVISAALQSVCLCVCVRHSHCLPPPLSRMKGMYESMRYQVCD